MPFLVAGITLLIKPGQRLFHLDGYKQGGTEHEFFASFVGEPDYDKVKAAVLEILHGKRKPRSRTLSSGPRSGPGAAVVPPHHRWRAMIYVVDNNEVMEHLTPAPQQRDDDAHAVAAAITRTLLSLVASGAVSFPADALTFAAAALVLAVQRKELL